jgi:hypothetical protein
MGDWLKSQLKGLFSDDIPKEFRATTAKAVVAAVVVLLGMALTLWRSLWRSSVLGIDPEVGRQAIFLLSVALVWSVLLARGRRLPIVVKPLRHIGNDALVEVTNLGPRSDFYASAEILEVREEDEPFNFRRMTLEPTWSGGLNYPSVTLKRHQVRSLCLASHLERDGDWMRVQFSDCGGRGQVWQWTPQVDPGLLALARVTITREEKASPFRRPRRPFSAVLVITGYGEGGLSVKHAKLKRRRWWRRPSIQLANLEVPAPRVVRIKARR